MHTLTTWRNDHTPPFRPYRTNRHRVAIDPRPGDRVHIWNELYITCSTSPTHVSIRFRRADGYRTFHNIPRWLWQQRTTTPRLPTSLQLTFQPRGG